MAAWWYDSDNRGQRGPILPDGLKALADHGLLKPSDPVRAEGMTEWIPARRLSGLFVLSSSPQPADESASLPSGEATPDIQNEPMIPFWPFPAVGLPTEPPVSKPWQFSLKEMLAAVGLVAAACGAASLIIRFGNLSKLGTIVGIVAIPSLLAGAVGVLVGKPKKWFLYGGLAGVALLAGHVSIFLLIVVGTIFFVDRAANLVKAEKDPARAIALRQTSIYRLSAISCVSLLLLWVPIVFLVAPGSGCRPMGQTLLTMIFIFPITVIAILRAVLQLIVTLPEKRIAVKAIVVAIFPIVVYLFTQWLILSVFGIIYED